VGVKLNTNVELVDYLEIFIEQNQGTWTHENWLHLVESINSKFDEVNIDDIGKILERKKQVYQAKKNGFDILNSEILEEHCKYFIEQNNGLYSRQNWLNFLNKLSTLGYYDMDELSEIFNNEKFRFLKELSKKDIYEANNILQNQDENELKTSINLVNEKQNTKLINLYKEKVKLKDVIIKNRNKEIKRLKNLLKHNEEFYSKKKDHLQKAEDRLKHIGKLITKQKISLHQKELWVETNRKPLLEINDETQKLKKDIDKKELNILKREQKLHDLKTSLEIKTKYLAANEKKIEKLNTELKNDKKKFIKDKKEFDIRNKQDISRHNHILKLKVNLFKKLDEFEQQENELSKKIIDFEKEKMEFMKNFELEKLKQNLKLEKTKSLLDNLYKKEEKINLKEEILRKRIEKSKDIELNLRNKKHRIKTIVNKISNNSQNESRE
jgi:hypothetical protein